jgi:Ca2+-binding RTX toxin-like protein
MILTLLDDSVEWNLDTLVLIDGNAPYTEDAFPDDGLIKFEFTQFTALYNEVHTYFQFDELLGKTLDEISTLRNVIFENRVIATSGTGFTIRGSDLSDTIFASNGDDILYDKGSTDRFRGGAGDDTYYISNSNTDVSEGIIIVPPPGNPDGPFVDFDRDAGGMDQVFASTPYQLPAFVENLTLIGSSFGAGNELDNIITGDELTNELRGEAGDDRLIGGGGDDVIDGGTGSDTLVLSGGRGDYSFARLPGGAVSVSDARTDSPDGLDQIRDIEVIEFLEGNLRPVGAIQATGNSEVLQGTSQADIFFFDTALGIHEGKDTIRNFGIGDRIVTTSPFADPNMDGRISANSSDRFALPSFIDDGAAPVAGSLRVFSATGVFSHLQLERTQIEDGVTFYVYSTVNDSTASTDLVF